MNVLQSAKNGKNEEPHNAVRERTRGLVDAVEEFNSSDVLLSDVADLDSSSAVCKFSQGIAFSLVKLADVRMWSCVEKSGDSELVHAKVPRLILGDLECALLFVGTLGQPYIAISPLFEKLEELVAVDRVVLRTWSQPLLPTLVRNLFTCLALRVTEGREIALSLLNRIGRLILGGLRVCSDLTGHGGLSHDDIDGSSRGDPVCVLHLLPMRLVFGTVSS